MNWKEFAAKIKKKKMEKSDWLILVLAGILLLVVVLPTEQKADSKSESEEYKKTEQTMVQNEASISGRSEVEKRLAEILSRIEGAGEVEVMITYKDNGTHVVEKDDADTNNTAQEADSTGGSRTTKEAQTQEETVFDEAEGGNTPFVAQELTPAIEGILIVASGGDKTQVKQNISEAVLALFPVEAHRIKIVKMNWQEGGE